MITRSDELPTVRQAVIKRKKIHYDFCSTRKLSVAKKEYAAFKYIGSNDGVIYINGVRNDFKQRHHFFVNK